MKAYIGIDPGASGAICVLPEDELPAVLRFINSTDKQICDFFSTISMSYDCFAVMELVGAMPGQGVSSMFNFGNSFGFIRGVLVATSIPFELKVSRTWQKALGFAPRRIERGEDKKELPSSESKTEFKRRLREKAEQLFPNVKMTNDVADAYLIAEYCRRTRLNQLV